MESIIVSGSLEFYFKLDKLLSSDSPNVVFSPFSLSTALAMTLLGSHNQSAEELSNVLFGKIIKPNEYQSLAKEYQILIKRCLEINEEVLSSANFLYSHINYSILQNYKQMIESSFGSKTQELDFVSKNKEAMDTINKDISDATKGKIQTLFTEIAVDSKVVLANALFFKGFWESKFKKEDTKNRKFTTNDKTEIEVQMMYLNVQNSKFPYIESQELKCRAIQLRYQNTNIVMIVILPDEDSSLIELKSNLNPITLNQLIKGLRFVKIELYLPKFKIESQFLLIPVLKQIGIKQIFSGSADLSGINGDQSLYVSDVIQKAVIEVNEEGTEAAAATAIVCRKKGTVFVPRFEANRPFMFLLISNYDSDKNMILFSGTVNNPNA